jgi:hypothetical protein
MMVVTEIDPESPSSLKPTGSWAKVEQRPGGYGWLGYRNVDDSSEFNVLSTLLKLVEVHLDTRYHSPARDFFNQHF